MEVQIIRQEDIEAYAELFWSTFNQNADQLRLDFLSKINGTLEIKPIPLGCYDDGVLVAATTIFPLLFEEGKQHWLGGQIGDALVAPSFRGKGLFNQLITEAQNVASKEGYDFLFTFPSINNPGSYKSFVKNNWKEIYQMGHYEIQVNSGLIGRLIRRINDQLYLRFEQMVLPVNQSIVLNPDWRKQGVHSRIDKSYLDYKRYLRNCIIELKSGLAYISIGKFSVTLSHFELKEGCSFELFLQELLKLIGQLAKDTLSFYVAPSYEKQFSATHLCPKDQDMKAMVYGLNEDLTLDRINFIGSDIDTF